MTRARLSSSGCGPGWTDAAARDAIPGLEAPVDLLEFVAWRRRVRIVLWLAGGALFLAGSVLAALWQTFLLDPLFIGGVVGGLLALAALGAGAAAWQDRKRRQAWEQVDQGGTPEVETESERRRLVIFGVGGLTLGLGVVVAGGLTGAFTPEHPCPKGARSLDLPMEGHVDARHFWCETSDGLRVGLEVERYDAEAIALERSWEQGALHGASKRWTTAGVLVEQGEWAAGKEHGLWQAWYDDGSPRSEVTWAAGEQVGPFKEWHPDGTLSKEGTYAAGKLVGEHRRFWEGGALKGQEQYSADGRPIGRHLSYFKSGGLRQEKGYDDDSERDGVFATYTADGSVVESQSWRAGTKHGPQLAFHDNGSQKLEASWVDGELDGSWRMWHDSGTLAQTGTYAAGVQVDRWLDWYADGTRQQDATYDDQGRLHGPVLTWHPNGVPKDELNYVAGVYEGLWSAWDDQGRPRELGAYVAGQADGVWRYYEDGELSRAELWSKGRSLGPVDP
jgi:antitoxin component YwqK of YwqJK toxin-antitoxin module